MPLGPAVSRALRNTALGWSGFCIYQGIEPDYPRALIRETADERQKFFRMGSASAAGRARHY